MHYSQRLLYKKSMSIILQITSQICLRCGFSIDSGLCPQCRLITGTLKFRHFFLQKRTELLRRNSLYLKDGFICLHQAKDYFHGNPSPEEIAVLISVEILLIRIISFSPLEESSDFSSTPRLQLTQVSFHFIQKAFHLSCLCHFIFLFLCTLCYLN